MTIEFITMHREPPADSGLVTGQSTVTDSTTADMMTTAVLQLWHAYGRDRGDAVGIEQNTAATGGRSPRRHERHDDGGAG